MSRLHTFLAMVNWVQRMSSKNGFEVKGLWWLFRYKQTADENLRKICDDSDTSCQQDRQLIFVMSKSSWTKDCRCFGLLAKAIGWQEAEVNPRDLMVSYISIHFVILKLLSVQNVVDQEIANREEVTEIETNLLIKEDIETKVRMIDINQEEDHGHLLRDVDRGVGPLSIASDKDLLEIDQENDREEGHGLEAVPHLRKVRMQLEEQFPSFFLRDPNQLPKTWKARPKKNRRWWSSWVLVASTQQRWVNIEWKSGHVLENVELNASPITVCL